MYLQLKFSLKLLSKRLGDALKQPKPFAQYICNIRLCRLHTEKYITDFKKCCCSRLLASEKIIFMGIFNCIVGLCF